MISGNDIKSVFDYNFEALSFCPPFFLSKNPLKKYLKEFFFSPLCDGYLKRLVSFIELPAEINLKWPNGSLLSFSIKWNLLCKKFMH